MTLEDYNRESGKNETLEDSNQVIVYSSREKYDQKRLKIFDLDFSVKEVTEDFITHDRVSTDVANSHFVIVRDSAVLEHVEAMQKLNFGENAAETVCYMGFDLSGTPEQKAEAHWEINERLDRRNFKGRFKSRDAIRRQISRPLRRLLFPWGVFGNPVPVRHGVDYVL